MSKISPEDKVFYCQQILSGNMSKEHIAKITEVAPASVYMWVKMYESMGVEAFTRNGNKTYSKELKVRAVEEYLMGKDSQYGICKKYGIKSTALIRKWILQYNGHEDFTVLKTGGKFVMTKGRKTTFNERIEIVQYCIAHEHNYKDTAEKYTISYQQARNYTIKYEQNGIDGLKDNRGRRKPEEEMSELEKLRAENRILRAEKQRAQMEISFLKKLDEIERRRG